MTATFDNITHLIREYAAAMTEAAAAEPHTATEDYWLTRAAHLSIQITEVLNSFLFLASTARDVTDHRVSDLGLLRYALSRLDRLNCVVKEPKLAKYALEPDGEPLPEPTLDDTQEINTDAILKALEPDPLKPRWGGW